MAEFSNAVSAASSAANIRLTAGFAADLLQNGMTQITIDQNNDITVFGSGALTAMTGSLHFNIVNSGTGTIRFENVDLANPGGHAGTGGMLLNGGKWEFANCTFTGLTKTAVEFGGNANDAVFTGCTFKDNLSRAVTLRAGTAADKAEYEFRNCLFQGNKVTNSGGGAVRITGSYFSLNISGCAFIENKAVGTGTASGSNNIVDGGALYVSTDHSTDGTLNISDSYFENNFAQDDGGAIIVIGNQVSTTMHSKIANCTFSGNTVAGAHYGKTGVPIFGSIWITDGSGGAVNYFGLTESEITHCTFYNNGITNVLPAGVSGSNWGSIGGGGAIAVDTGELITSNAQLPPVPKLSNNIFVGNYVKYPMTQGSIDLVNSLASGLLGDVKERSRTGNVFVLPMCDLDFQGVPQGQDIRMLQNNGNIGYDNGNYDTYGNPKANGYHHVTGSSGYSSGINKNDGIVVKNIFVSYSSTPNRGDDNTAIPTEYGNPVGAAGSGVYRKCFIPSPTSNELYRDGSVPYAVEVPYDTLGNARDTFPNAGAVEIYWTMFNPGTGADWTAAVPAGVEKPDGSGEVYPVIKSLNFTTNSSYYVMTASGTAGLAAGDIAAMPRSAVDHSDPNFGLLGWRSSLPDLNWNGYTQWAGSNGHTEPSVQEFLQNHPVSDLPPDAFPLYQPGNVVLSVKQTLTAEWYQDLFRADFDLNYGSTPNWYTSSEAGKEAPRLSVPAGSTIAAPLDPARAGYNFGGWYKDAACTAAWDFGSDAVTADIVLYAKWTDIAYSVVYHDTGATGGSAPADPNSPYTAGSAVTVLGHGTLKRAGFTFSGWSTSPGSSSPAYNAGSTFVISGDVNLYPVWTYVPTGPGGGAGTVFHIYASADFGSLIDPSGTVAVVKGGSAEFTFSALSGHEITSVIIDGAEHPELAGACSYTFSDVGSDHSISVVSAPKDTAVAPPPEPAGKGEWSPLNLICAVIALLSGMIGLTANRSRKADTKGKEPRRSGSVMFMRVLGLIIGTASVILFFLTEDWTQPPVPVDWWTLWMFILLIAGMAVFFAGFRSDKAEEKETDKR